jgi:thiol-disulfide isomerase/thioredoxin
MPITAALVAIAIANSGAGDEPPTEPPIVLVTPYTVLDQPAPDFRLAMPEGGELALSDWRGGWVVLNFWATWCGPCRAEMPLLQDLHEGRIAAAAPLGTVRVLAVNFKENAAAANAFSAENDLRLPVVLDGDGAVAAKYIVINLPVTYFIDPAGVVRYRQIGGFTPELLDAALAQMIAKGTPLKPSVPTGTPGVG